MLQSVSPDELKRQMDSPQGVFILDVRTSEAFREWRIQDKGVQSLNIQTSLLKERGPRAYPELPADREIVTVCAKGVAAQEAASILEQNGYRARYLEGGMQAWSSLYHPVTVVRDERLELIQVLRPAKGCLSYVLISDGEAIVVDPARHTHVYEEWARVRGAVIRHVMDTHLHADHISGGEALAAATGAKYWIAESEMRDAKRAFHPLRDGDLFSFGRSRLGVLAIPTPGHTPGSTSFMVNDHFFLSGDTVFVSGLGRPDLGGKAEEWAGMLYRTVVEKLHALPDDVVVLPAHYSDYREITDDGYVGARLGDLRQHNALLRGGDMGEFTASVTAGAGAAPPNYEKVVEINRGQRAVTEQEATELEIGPNRCAVKHG